MITVEMVLLSVSLNQFISRTKRTKDYKCVSGINARMLDLYMFFYIDCSRYDIMLNCWDETPGNRKSFTDLRKHFDAMLSSMTSKVSIMFLILNMMGCLLPQGDT